MVFLYTGNYDKAIDQRDEARRWAAAWKKAAKQKRESAIMWRGEWQHISNAYTRLNDELVEVRRDLLLSLRERLDKAIDQRDEIGRMYLKLRARALRLKYERDECRKNRNYLRGSVEKHLSLWQQKCDECTRMEQHITELEAELEAEKAERE